ncbi:hypothetical protein HPT25_22300 [Bacillus sp. BRMEA1]|uniref:hypothetical protein n=1 Tax=Neobacillus endophyticus TaxID=2738405 RepID=UPI001564CBCD|nr:hypothetical protein [Neobacillus endophyticus]NRD80073.1 hypothetical protein [Neobacillus endophyticus]
MHIYGIDYIKYLNDEGSGRITYDQWKSKNFKKEAKKCQQCGNEKDQLHHCPKCK